MVIGTNRAGKLGWHGPPTLIMKVRVNNNTTTGGGEIFAPDDPIPPIDLAEYFTVERFETTETEAAPFSEVTVRWTIEAKDEATEFDDFDFRLIGPRLFTVPDIAAEGEHTFRMRYTTSLRLEGRRNGSRWAALGPTLTVSIDDTTCRSLEFPGSFIDERVYEEMRQVTTERAELRLRSALRPTDPENPHAPRERVQLQPQSDWNAERIRYDFPLELVVPNFFNADVDVQMDITFAVDLDETGSDIVIGVEFESDVDYSAFEEFLSLGIAPWAEAFAEIAISMALEGRKSAIETLIKDEVLLVPFVDSALETGQFYDIRLHSRPPAVYEHLEILICDDGRVPDDQSEPVASRSETARQT